MMHTSLRHLYYFLLGSSLLFVACETDPTLKGKQLQITPISVPSDSFSMFPSLRFGPDDVLYMNWLSEPDTVSRLMVSQLRTSGQWSAPMTVTAGSNWFVNWADFPALAIGPNGHLLTYVLPKSSDDTYAYDVGLFQSIDNGKQWQGPIVPHKDGVAAEHGFVSFFPMPDDKIGTVWLDGRNYALQAATDGSGHEGHHSGGEPDMTLRFASINRQGGIADEYELDAKVCSCCQTDAAVLKNGAIVVYRDRTDEEIRDISYVRWLDGAWTAPLAIAEEGWEINGCPVNGPAVAAFGEQVAVSWFTMADDEAKVQLAFSRDNGEQFGAPIRLDDGQPIGRVDVQFWDAEHVLASWIERDSSKQAYIRMKMIAMDGGTVQDERVAGIDAARASGFPRMAVRNGKGYLAWTETGEKPVIRMVEIEEW